MKKRVAGILRVKNDGCFIEKCIESCIDALDELIVVYNDCTDNSAEEIAKMASKYPEKIRYYAYPYEVRAFDLTRDQFEEVKGYEEGNPHLFSTASNFALEKVTAEYALKIDADQVYFTKKLKEWCDFLRDCKPMKLTPKVFVGRLFQYYLSVYRKLSMIKGRVLPMMPEWFIRLMYSSYISYAKYSFSHDEACMALSGVNVLETDKTLVSMGHESDKLLMLCPFNGIGDTVMFKVNDKVSFRKMVMNEYNKEDSKTFCVAEEFVHPYKRITYVGYFWKHIRTMRPGVMDKAIDAHDEDPEAFLDIPTFKKLKYRDIIRHSPDKIFFPFQKILFGFIYKANRRQLFESLKNEPLGGAVERN